MITAVKNKLFVIDAKASNISASLNQEMYIMFDSAIKDSQAPFVRDG